MSIYLYFPVGCQGEGHAVAVGRWQGRLWVSSNGGYEEADSIDAVRDIVSREQHWESSEVWSVVLKPADVQRFIQRDRDSYSS